MENKNLDEIKNLNPDFEIQLHEMNVNVGDEYKLVYYVHVEHKDSKICVYNDKDFNEQEVINRLPLKFTIEKKHSMLPKGVRVSISNYSSNSGIYISSGADNYFINHTANVTIDYPLKNPYIFSVKCNTASDLIDKIILAYRKIYAEEKEQPGKYGIWGHSIEDLQLVRITLDITTGNIKLGVDS